MIDTSFRQRLELRDRTLLIYDHPQVPRLGNY